MGSDGRVLLRPSGTEPLIRVMVEGREADVVVANANSIADAVRAQLTLIPIARRRLPALI